MFAQVSTNTLIQFFHFKLLSASVQLHSLEKYAVLGELCIVKKNVF